MKDTSDGRFSEFWRSAYGTTMTALTHGGQQMRTLAATVALSLVSCFPGQAQAQEQIALLARPASAGTSQALSVTGSRARDALKDLMQVHCPPKSVATTIADGNLACRIERRVGVESTIEKLADADMVGEVLDMPVFLAPSERVYVAHVDSRGEGREWTPMLVLSEGLVDALLSLPEGERKAAMGFVLARERALMRGVADDFADFEAFQYAYFLGLTLEVAEAGISNVMAVEASHAGEASKAHLPKRVAMLKEYFSLEREMVAQARARESAEKADRAR